MRARMLNIDGWKRNGHRAPEPAAKADIPAPSARLRAFLQTPSGHSALSAVAGYFHATLEGAQHIPKSGGGLIVSNHALFALDSAALGALIIRDLGRYPRFLADHKLWNVPGLRQVIAAVGGLPGSPHAAQRLLENGELVVVYPGGVDDSLKLRSQRYTLQWKTRAGFARVAMAAKAPIIPVVGLGIDEMYDVVAREHLLGRRLFGSPRYDLPVAFGAFGTLIPKRAEQHFVVLPPIATEGDPNSADDVERVRAAVFQALDAQLARVRAQAG